MAELSTANPTLLDIAKATDPNGGIATVVEMLHQKNDILDHATWLEANDGSTHVTTVRTGLPQPTWRKLYGGVQPTKSTRAQIKDATGSLWAYAEVDKELADKSGNAAAFRLSEDSAHIEGMNQEFAQTLFYGNEGTAPAEFTGLAPRFNSLTGSASGYNIIDAAGNDSDLTSMWLIVWGPQTAFNIYPKGAPGGLEMKDHGEVTIEDADGSNGGRMQAYRTHYKWSCGLVVRDWRYIVRIANIDISALTKDASSGADLLDLMSQALELPPDLSSGRAAFYCSRTIRSFLRRQARKGIANSTLALDNIGGKKFVTYDDVPVGRCDAISHAEDRVV